MTQPCLQDSVPHSDTRAAGTEAQLHLDQIQTLEERLGIVEKDIKVLGAESAAMQKALAGAEQAKKAAEEQASIMEIMVQMTKEEALGLGKLLQRADEEILKLKTAIAVSTEPCFPIFPFYKALTKQPPFNC